MIHKGSKTLTSKRLILRKITISDAEDMFYNWASRDKVTRLMTWDSHQNVEFSRNMIKDWIKNYAQDDFYFWVIEYSGQAIGIVEIRANFHSYEAAYVLGDKWWNLGITTEALYRVFQFLFEECEFQRIFAIFDEENAASGRVMEKCGMKKEGLLRGHLKTKRNKMADVLFYGIIKEDWFEQNKKDKGDL